MTIQDRLSAGIRVEGACWVWARATDEDGYGRIAVFGKNRKAHKVAFEAWVGPVAPGFCVCHRCDRPACINPDHLFLGTHVDNMRDMARKGRRRGIRATAGETHGMAKLSDIDVRTIRAAVETRAELARRYGVSISTIGMILGGKIWR